MTVAKPAELDWSTVAAWIALIISIVGYITGPLITAIITNIHQTKLRKMDLEEKYADQRSQVIHAFISNIGKLFTYGNSQDLQNYGASYHLVYAYVSDDLWDKLDQLYSFLQSGEYDKAQPLYVDVTHKLAAILKESLPKRRRK